MVIMNVLHMNGGDDETSYANNSGLQGIVINKAKPVLDDTLSSMFNDGLPDRLVMVDLGCSSGPNTLLSVSNIVDTVEELCRQNNSRVPEFQIFLNDLPDNDFNNLFKLLPTFYHQLNHEERDNNASRCFISALPGSFYGRLFPIKSINLAYSSYSLHWLSQIPEGLENNRENIYMSMTSPRNVVEAYSMQYRRDFTKFLRLRAEEILAGGYMVLTFIGRSVADPSCKDDCAHFTLVAESLLDMVAEGHVKKDDLYSFNIPMYTPYRQEVETLIHSEGSFDLENLQVFEVDWDANCNVPFDKVRSGKLVANCVRAFMEPMLASHFGSSIIDELFSRYAKKLAHHLSRKKSAYFNITISLRRR